MENFQFSNLRLSFLLKYYHFKELKLSLLWGLGFINNDHK